MNAQYELILGRAPDPEGGASAVAYLKTGGSLAQLANDLFDSVEYESKLVATYYQTFLRRNGSAAEISNWVNAMQAGLTEEQVASDFLNSVEYSALFPANATFVQALYGDVLGRLPSSAELTSWLTSGATRSQEVAGFLGSIELANRMVYETYGVINNRAAEPAEQAYIASLIQVGRLTEQGLAVEYMSNAEFIARANATVR